MNICVIGSGYVGLVTGSCLADSGNNVICLDIDKSKISSLKKGKVGIYEPGLSSIVERNVKSNRLNFTTNYKSAIESSEIIFLAVSTPPNEDGSANLDYIKSAALELSQYMNSYKIIVTKSTVPVGTTALVRDLIATRTDQDFDVASNPEFLKEGSAINDFMFPDRIVIGVESPKAEKKLKELYEPFMRKEFRLVVVDIRSSELSKYASNAMLATRISFINEIANLCEKVGADIESVRKIMSEDKRIGRHFIFPGLGYGGSCFPKDVKSLIDIGKQNSMEMELCTAVDNVNANQRVNFFKKIEEHFKILKNKRFALWGLSFKPNTDDIREAPSIDIARFLIGSGAKVLAHDPVASENFKELFSDSIAFSSDNYNILRDCDALIINTEWSEYKQPDFEKIKNLLKTPVIFDGRNLYNKQKMKDLGFFYSNIGFYPENGIK
ncbi:UDP-glucose/GDP-mannose dehydrogenase family protein [bacterium]|jgi:UDPglucose 6-dehydrogenase|nr:UDP-glucose/GDP-mannose dehydrogenase family protein [bacterium]MBT3795725.1 UDP-glucose/GDP-mannose dehydrogenase family protein [bacterium]MBT4633925.1 UDP-glucose/GDP-mannose dehydrogenase family protein [bacterium]